MNSKRTFFAFRSLFIINCLLFLNGFAAFEDMESGATHAAMSGAGVAQSFGPASLFVNPALICGTWGFAVDYYHPFSISEISSMQIVCSYPLAKLTLATAVSVYGNKIYGEQQFHAVGSFAATAKFSLAVDVCAGNLSIRDYGSDWTYWLNAGFYYQFSGDLAWGASIKNVNNAIIGVNREAVPQVIQTGIRYSAVPRLHLNLDLYKDSHFAMDVMAGLTVDLTAHFCIRAGFGNEPSRISAGFSLRLMDFSIDYAYLNITELTATHLFTVQFFISDKHHEN